MATDATVTVESSPTDVLKSLTPAQHKTWRETGEIPESKSPPAKETPKEEKTEAASSPAAKTEVAAPAPEKAAEKEPAKSAPAVEEPKANAETRIKDLLAENKELKVKLDAMQKAPVAAPAKTEAPAKPHRNDVDAKTGQVLYATDEAFEEAHEKYLTEKVTQDVRKQVAKEAEDRQVAEQTRILQQRMINSIKITTEKHPDFQQVLKAKDIEKDGKKITVFEADAVKRIKSGGMIDRWILDSDIGMEMLYHLAKNPDEVDRIEALNPFAAARELTKLEDKLSAPPSATPSKKEEEPAKGSAAPKVSGAPAPAASVNGKGTAPLDEELAATEAGDFKRFQKAANEADFRKKKAS